MMKINLLLRREKVSFCSSLCVNFPFLLVIGTSVLILLLWHIFLVQKIAVVRKKENALSSQIKAIDMGRQKNRPEHSGVNQPDEIGGHMDVLEENLTGLVEFFEALHDGARDRLFLSSIGFTEREIKIVGHASSMQDLEHFVHVFAESKSDFKVEIERLSHKNGSYDFVMLLRHKK